MYLYNNWRSIVATRWFHPVLLLIWFFIGLSLRLANLTGKPPWTDEFSTLVFSLGNSFLPVPLDQAIAPEILLQPLQPQATANISEVWTHLSQETNHPPLYFFLAHWWMRLFPTPQGLVSLWGARSLAAILGAVSIPAIYTLSWLSFRSRLVSHLAAAMITVSPFGIFLAQEARHYTLAILWVIASFGCLVIATRHLQKQTPLPISLVLSWVVINALGIATHYFFALTLCTQAIVIIFLAWYQRPTKFSLFLSPVWQRIYAVAAGTFVAGIVWLPVFLQNSYGSKLTEWIQEPRVGFAWISPIFQALAAWITMLFLLPVEATQLGIVIVSGLGMLIFLIWALPILIRGFQVLLQQPDNRFTTQILGGLVLSAIALFLIFTYFLGIDLTRGARYNFVYFPAVILLLAASLGVCWQDESIGKWGIGGKKAVVLIWLVGFFSAVTVISNLGYQKYYRPDLFVQLIQQTSSNPVLIATTQVTHVQIGEMMGVAREFKISNSPSPSPLFLFAHQDQDPNSSTTSLSNTFTALARPFDLWLVNFHAPIAEEVQQCAAETENMPAIDGYVYELYHCE
ncbi:glycosyltransferase [Nodularia harveyana UHCC-0300]|uniref:Glycosyltransferase n=1 Tax=Nodularia harveyana UHCC-0300 TaxID=2974287 RepID=A0ABU5UIG6_9CYAN|nr:glycosyltransferase [Nodularia harveyana]MEA5583295.1 glycosyltransferase [Nodularia harveyana UHCC-0300]